LTQVTSGGVVRVSDTYTHCEEERTNITLSLPCSIG